MCQRRLARCAPRFSNVSSAASLRAFTRLIAAVLLTLKSFVPARVPGGTRKQVSEVTSLTCTVCVNQQCRVSGRVHPSRLPCKCSWVNGFVLAIILLPGRQAQVRDQLSGIPPPSLHSRSGPHGNWIDPWNAATPRSVDRHPPLPNDEPGDLKPHSPGRLGCTPDGRSFGAQELALDVRPEPWCGRWREWRSHEMCRTSLVRKNAGERHPCPSAWTLSSSLVLAVPGAPRCLWRPQLGPPRARQLPGVSMLSMVALWCAITRYFPTPACIRAPEPNRSRADLRRASVLARIARRPINCGGRLSTPLKSCSVS